MWTWLRSNVWELRRTEGKSRRVSDFFRGWLLLSGWHGEVFGFFSFFLSFMLIFLVVILGFKDSYWSVTDITLRYSPWFWLYWRRKYETKSRRKFAFFCFSWRKAGFMDGFHSFLASLLDLMQDLWTTLSLFLFSPQGISFILFLILFPPIASRY